MEGSPPDSDTDLYKLSQLKVPDDLDSGDTNSFE